MYQIADNLLSETMYILTVIQFLWNGMDPLLVGMTDRNFRLWPWSCKNGHVYITGVTLGGTQCLCYL